MSLRSALVVLLPLLATVGPLPAQVGPFLNLAPFYSWDESADAAYDATNDTWLVAWNRLQQFQPDELVGRFVAPDGTMGASEFSLLTDPVVDVRIANVKARGAFVAVWADGGDIRARSVSAGTGAMSAPITVATGVDALADASVGGDPGGGDAAVVVWRNTVTGVLGLARVRVSPSGDLSVDGTRTLGTPFAAAPDITKGAGVDGRHLVVWTGSGAVVGAVIDLQLDVLAGPFPISPLGVDLEDDPAVDGDGEHWMVAYESQSLVSLSLVFAQPVAFDPGSARIAVGDPVSVAPGNQQKQASVAWVGESALVGHRGSGFGLGGPGVFCTSLDPFTAARCEGVTPIELDGYPRGPRRLRLVSQRSGDPAAPDGAIAVYDWEFPPIKPGSGDVDIAARIVQPVDGRVTDLGGGCGDGGRAHVSCAVVGNADFTHRLTRAAPRAAAGLLLSAAANPVPCGAGALVPDLRLGLLFVAGLTDARGRIRLTTAIPNRPSLVGGRLVEQWVVARPGAPCLFGIDMSNALEVEIQ